jgi:hypothetical protein
MAGGGKEKERVSEDKLAASGQHTSQSHECPGQRCRPREAELAPGRNLGLKDPMLAPRFYHG